MAAQRPRTCVTARIVLRPYSVWSPRIAIVLPCGARRRRTWRPLRTHRIGAGAGRWPIAGSGAAPGAAASAAVATAVAITLGS
jgi:hypothetical protein